MKTSCNWLSVVRILLSLLLALTLITCFSGIAIALAHDGKTRQELASELTHMEDINIQDTGSDSAVKSNLGSNRVSSVKSFNFFVRLFIRRI